MHLDGVLCMFWCVHTIVRLKDESCEGPHFDLVLDKFQNERNSCHISMSVGTYMVKGYSPIT